MRTIKKGATSQSVYFDVLDSTSTTGGRKTGLAFNTSSLVAYYVRSQGSAVAITLATLAAANTAWSSGGFKEVDATNMPGIYRLDVPDAAFATGAGDSVAIVIKGATGMVQASYDVQLVAWDPQDTVRGGLTALPNAAAEAAGGLYTRGTGAGQINQDGNGRVDANAKAWAGTATTLTSGLPDVNMKTITAGIIAAASFAANALDAVWSTTTRLLTAGTNIALAKGTGVTGFTDLDASGVRAAVGLASANLDTQLSTIAGYIDTEVGAIKAKTDSLTFTVSGQVDVNVVDWKGSAAPAMTGDAYARLGAPAGASTAADVAAIKAVLPSALVSGRIDASVGAMAANTMTAAAAAADLTTELQTGLATASAVATLQTSVDDVPTNAELATALAGADDAVLAQVALVKAKTDNLPADPADASDIAGAFASLQSHGDGAWVTATGFSTLGAVDVTDAVWDVQLTDHVDSGSMGQSLFYAQQGANSADSKASNIYGDTQAIRGLTDTLVNTGGKLWVLDGDGNALATGSDVTAIKSVTTKLDDTVEDNAGTFRFTADALALAPTGGTAPTAGEIADAVWDEALADHVTDGTGGKALGDTVSMVGTIEGRIGTPAYSDLAGDIAHAQGSIDSIKAKTDNLPDDPADESLIIDATTAIMDRVGVPAGASISADIAAKASQTSVDDLPTNAELATALAGLPAAPTVAAIADEVETRTLPANMIQINGTTLTGDGSSGDKFGPA